VAGAGHDLAIERPEELVSGVQWVAGTLVQHAAAA
jgi:hypothetical protein